MSVELILFVITPVDHTDVNVQLDLLLALIQWTHKIQFVLVRTKHSRNFSSINSRSRLHLQKLWASYKPRVLNWKSIYNFLSWWAVDAWSILFFLLAISLRFWMSVVHADPKAVFLKLREEICNLEFLQILTHFSSLFAPPRADFLLLV